MNIKIFILMTASISLFSNAAFAQTKSTEKTGIHKTNTQDMNVTKKINGKAIESDPQATKNGNEDFYRIEGHQGYAVNTKKTLTDCVIPSGAKDKNCNGLDDTKEATEQKGDRRVSERLRHKSRK